MHFIEHSAAVAFWRHAFYHGIALKGQPLGAWMKADKPHLARLVKHIATRVAEGASRCLRIVGLPYLMPSAIQRDFERFGPVERVELM